MKVLSRKAPRGRVGRRTSWMRRSMHRSSGRLALLEGRTQKQVSKIVEVGAQAAMALDGAVPAAGEAALARSGCGAVTLL